MSFYHMKQHGLTPKLEMKKVDLFSSRNLHQKWISLTQPEPKSLVKQGVHLNRKSFGCERMEQLLEMSLGYDR